MTVVEAMVAEIDGWDDDLRVNLPTAQYFQYRVLATEVPRGFRTVHPLGWINWKGK